MGQAGSLISTAYLRMRLTGRLLLGRFARIELELSFKAPPKRGRVHEPTQPRNPPAAVVPACHVLHYVTCHDACDDEAHGLGVEVDQP